MEVSKEFNQTVEAFKNASDKVEFMLTNEELKSKLSEDDMEKILKHFRNNANCITYLQEVVKSFEVSLPKASGSQIVTQLEARANMTFDNISNHPKLCGKISNADKFDDIKFVFHLVNGDIASMFNINGYVYGGDFKVYFVNKNNKLLPARINKEIVTYTIVDAKPKKKISKNFFEV
ncbi:MAG: hypothetical protein ACRCZI_03300 [Cetobacterium sp.]